MNRRGFTLVEMLIVMAIIAILLAVSTIAFNRWVNRNKVETQFKTMYADLMTARSQALYNKNGTGKSVIITTSGFSMYATTDTTLPAVLTKILKVPVTPATTQIDFDQNGVAKLNGDDTVTDAYVCVQTNTTSAIFNSLIISKTRIQMGTFSGGVCSSANVKPQ
jgi:prepilin-type N-terminal cleavage/methylation domain-containing protein